MAKFQRILGLFPGFYGASEDTKLLYRVVQRLAQPLEEIDTHLFRIQRAHRINVAEHSQDILLLAASLNLTPYDFEDLLENPDWDYHQKLALMRQRVKQIARIHLNGLGTPRAVMQSAAIFLNAVIVPEKQNDPLIKHMDNDGYSHQAVIEFSLVPDKPRERIYLYENPLRRKKVDLAQRYPMNSWPVKNENVMESPMRVVIKGIGERTVLPRVFCPQTGEGLLFNGIVPEGKTLVIDSVKGAVLEHEPVDEWVIYFQGGLFEFSSIGAARYVEEEGGLPDPFDGNLEGLISRPFQKKKPVPAVPRGDSQWYYAVGEGVYDQSNYDFAVTTDPHEPLGVFDEQAYDGSVFDYPASGIVGMAWDERIPCAFKLSLPPVLPKTKPAPGSDHQDESESSSENDGPPANIVSRIGNILPRFKAAGIQCFVDKSKDAWILGESVMRDAASPSGPGVEHHSTRLYGDKIDQLVGT